MDIDGFSLAKQFMHVGDARIAYRDDGAGPPVLLLHGCPFSSFVWRKIIPRLADQSRCVAPDLLGLGDTETVSDADWSLPAQESAPPGTYGSPRVFEDLAEAGWKVSVNTVAASMARQGLQGRSPKRKRPDPGSGGG
jgi:pimeloyl-ACP methyl ester carboxylesterase